MELANQAFSQRWARAKLSQIRYFENDVCLEHFQSTTAKPYPGQEQSVKEPAIPNKKVPKKRSRENDFTATQPLFHLVGPLPQRASGVPSKFTTFFRDSANGPMFRLNDTDGKSRLICLKSASQAPFNACCTSHCDANSTKGKYSNDSKRQPYIHVDLSSKCWQSAPESHWADIVSFLKRSGVSEVIQPSDAFKALTPSAGW